MAFIKKKNNETKKNGTAEHTLNTPQELIDFAKKHCIELCPLDVSALTKLLNIKMRLEPLKGDDSGCLYKDKKTNEWIMLINSQHHQNRQRFTIAHELGHFIKHSGQNDFFKDEVFFRNNESNIIEVEANKFASELLMPKETFESFVQNNSQIVSEIAQYFGVSAMAVRIRAQQLGYKGHNL